MNDPTIEIPELAGVQTIGLNALNQNISKYFRLANQERQAVRVTLYGKLYAIILPGPKLETHAAMKAWHKKLDRRKRRPTPPADAGVDA